MTALLDARGVAKSFSGIRALSDVSLEVEAGELTALEAIMEAGGFSSVANKKKVVVIRYEDEKRRAYHLNFDDALKGTSTPPFFLEPSDIVHVPEVIF